MEEYDEAAMRDQVEKSTDPEIVAMRDVLEGGEVQPTYTLVETFELLVDQTEIRIGEDLELSLNVGFQVLDSLLEAEENRAMLVIRERSLSDNTFSVFIELGRAGEFSEPIREDPAEGAVAELSFFDHIDGEMHAPGDVISSQAIRGHFLLDITDTIYLLREQGIGEKELAVRFSARQMHADEPSSVSFKLGSVSLDVVAEKR